MFSQLKELYSLLTEDQRKNLRRLQFLVVLMAVAELGSVLSIGPFMALVGDMNLLQGEGMVGASASGKSTAIDLLLGLVQQEKGELLIDGNPITKQQLRDWQNSLGFVPQSVFLADSSIRENIAFGLPPELVDDDKVQRAATMAHLDELLAELPDGLNTRAGERGVQLSGGQRQRIGIARALYHDADVLIFGEVTSALDATHDFSGKKTIIMIAHRLATVKKCDSIYLLANGEVTDQGTYSELCQRNDLFKRMADHA